MLADRFLRLIYRLTVSCFFVLAATQPLMADGGVSFQDIATVQASGLEYRRAPSANKALFDDFKQSLSRLYTFSDITVTPMKSRGAPGVALLDYDRDGDLDIYVTNGPGMANSLFSSQWLETGELTFVDVAAAAGVAAADQDSTGACFGDIDNDGDEDLLVLGQGEPNRLFENQGNGTFTDITAASGVGVDSRTSTSCSLGDVNGDGLLDLIVANHYSNWNHQRAMFVIAFALNEHNQIFLNTGGNVFVDVSAESGIESLAGFPPQGEGQAGITWAIAVYDYDLDGDVDILAADDQAVSNFERGFLHIHRNDGSGFFTDMTVEAGANIVGGWMGLSFGDFNCDGQMDFFSTNIGDYSVLGNITGFASRWFLGQADGTFADPGVGELGTTPFGWGTSTFDYDNDGDTDILYHGGMDVNFFIDLGNPGALLQNQECSASFIRDVGALAGSTDHTRRGVQGTAVGDLNQDGFVDIVSASSFDVPDNIPLEKFEAYPSSFDDEAFYILSFRPIDALFTGFRWSGYTFADGTLSVEINSGGNGNSGVEIELRGSIDITTAGRVNRDGAGAVVFFTPSAAEVSGTVMHPIVAGSSYASQDSLAVSFGLGTAEEGVVEVLWPGGVRNRLYGVQAFERLLFPEIPCGFDAEWNGMAAYTACVDGALAELQVASVLDAVQAERFRDSALTAFLELQ